MTQHANTEARQKARALSRWEGEGGALAPTTQPAHAATRKHENSKSQSLVTAATVRRVTRPPGSGH